MMGTHLNENNEKTGTKEFLLGAIVGGVIGAVTALWLSPKSGTALRESVNDQTAVLKEKAGSLQVKVSDLAQKTKEKTSSLTQSITQQSSEAISKIRGKNTEEAGDNTEAIPAETPLTNNLNSIEQMLAETKKAFDETEKKLNR
ncbi:YtxH domain-containing protein [Neobacillus sp. LXY-4]|uniref:YtxH domain-containing protein n=1 Tax=Neobacillus sp. LXY-4 TaxID=3379826 RepID=UPI003EE0D6E2